VIIEETLRLASGRGRLARWVAHYILNPCHTIFHYCFEFAPFNNASRIHRCCCRARTEHEQEEDDVLAAAARIKDSQEGEAGPTGSGFPQAWQGEDGCTPEGKCAPDAARCVARITLGISVLIAVENSIGENSARTDNSTDNYSTSFFDIFGPNCRSHACRNRFINLVGKSRLLACRVQFKFWRN